MKIKVGENLLNCSSIHSSNKIISIYFEDMAIEDIVSIFEPVTSFEMYDEGSDGTEILVGDYDYVEYVSTTIFIENVIKVELKLLDETEVKIKTLEAAILELQQSQQDQDEAIIEIADTVFTV